MTDPCRRTSADSYLEHLLLPYLCFFSSADWPDPAILNTQIFPPPFKSPKTFYSVFSLGRNSGETIPIQHASSMAQIMWMFVPNSDKIFAFLVQVGDIDIWFFFSFSWQICRSASFLFWAHCAEKKKKRKEASGVALPSPAARPILSPR